MKTATLLCLVLAACSSDHRGMNSGGDDDVDAPGPGSADASVDAPQRIQTIFVIPLENKADTAIYGNTSDAPYINGLFATANHATMFKDELPSLDSEPHYIWMEAGTNAFTDHTFTNDNDSSTSNSTANTEHLVTQLKTAGIPWMSYQQGITAGKCPISSTGDYAAKHDPFVFFQDVVGSPPSANNTYCADHHKPYTTAGFSADLANGLTGYIFITPDICHDMHGSLSCPSGISSSSNIKAGDTWLSQELPRIIEYANTHDAVIFLTWDEGSSTNLIPFLALGAHVKPGTSNVMYTHSSLLKTTEEILGVPVLAKVQDANDFADMFEPGAF
jgi:hypothetical protein